jgi:hypothetical protein
MPNSRSMWFIVVAALVFLAAAFVTLRAAATVGADPPRHAQPAPTHPPASAPEETATIVDDPTTAPDAAQSADKNVSFPTDI